MNQTDTLDHTHLFAPATGNQTGLHKKITTGWQTTEKKIMTWQNKTKVNRNNKTVTRQCCINNHNNHQLKTMVEQ